jgi:hypothetical protein
VFSVIDTRWRDFTAGDVCATVFATIRLAWRSAFATYLAIALSVTQSRDACRHGGMTELEEAELTDGQGRALSGHRTQRAYEGYAKQSLERALPATRKRYAHVMALANAQGTIIQNAADSRIQNEGKDESAVVA